MSKVFSLKDPEYFDHDLVARVQYDGCTAYDTDATHLVRQYFGAFASRDEVTEAELIALIESEDSMGCLHCYFIRWEVPGEWSML